VNVFDHGAVGNGVVDDTNAIQRAILAMPNPGSIYFPRATYLVSEPLDFSAKTHGCHIFGDGHEGTGGSIIKGSIPNDDLIKYIPSGADRPIVVSDLRLWQTSATGRSALHVTNTISGYIANLRVSSAGTFGIYLPSNVFTLTIRDCRMNGIGNTGIGIFANSHAQIIECDVVGWDDGIRICGNKVSILGGRYEVCNRGIVLGVDQNGVSAQLRDAHLAGMRGEAHETAIFIQNLANSVMAAVSMQGSTGSPQLQSKLGMDVLTCTECEFHAVTMGGTHSIASIRVRNAANRSSFSRCTATNTHPTGKTWDVGVGLGQVRFDDCNYLLRPDDTVAWPSFARHRAMQYLAQADYLNANVEGKNLRGKGIVVSSGATTKDITFTAGGHTPGLAAINTAAASAGAGLADGTYYYAATAVTQHGECAAFNEKSVTLSAGNNQTTITFFGMTQDGFKRRVYRGTATGVYDGYYELPLNQNSAFTDTGAAFDGRKSPPAAAIDDTDMREPDANYAIMVTPHWNAGAVWVTNKATTGFTINFQSGPSGDNTVDWFMVR
jgi:hypothetical protein